MDERFRALLESGARVLSTRQPPPPRVIGHDRVDQQSAAGWAVSAQAAIDAAFGPTSAYAVRFREATTDPIMYPDALKAYGILDAAAADAPSGSVPDEETLVPAAPADSSGKQRPRFQIGVVVGIVLGWFLCFRRAEIIATLFSEDGIRVGVTAVYLTIILAGGICASLFSSAVHDHGWGQAFKRAPIRSTFYLLVALAGVFSSLRLTNVL